MFLKLHLFDKKIKTDVFYFNIIINIYFFGDSNMLIWCQCVFNIIFIRNVN